MAPRALRFALACAFAGLAGCASRPPASHPGRDGPGAVPPPGLEQVPDAEPRVEPLRIGGPNKPYEMMGQRYVPMTADLPLAESGLASWYGRKFHGLPTASGEPYDMYAMTAAHRTLPIPSYARVRNPANGREIVVRINDRGPFSAGRVIDLSYTAALKLGVLAGVSPVEVQRLTHAEIRAGLWRVRPPALPSSPPEAPLAADAAARAAEVLAEFASEGAGPVDRFWLQLGAFRGRDGAQALQQRVLRGSDATLAAVVEQAGWFRVQAGPYASRALAQEAGERLGRELGWAVRVIEREGRSALQP